MTSQWPSSPGARYPSLLTPAFTVLGVRVHAVQIPDVVAQMERWIEEGSLGHVVVAANTHVVMECRRDPWVAEAVRRADLVMPDGMPLVWLGRRRGFALRGRAYGPGVMEAFLAFSAPKGYRHFFLGSTPKTLEALVGRACRRWPGLRVVGAYSPPFRPLTPQEDKEVVGRIRDARPQVLWVGLGCPRQELWMYEHRERLGVPVMLGVGAAFDFLAGRKPQAPPWMRDHGLEWLFRLLTEPRRLWRRYLIQGGWFVFLVLLEELGLKRWREDPKGPRCCGP